MFDPNKHHRRSIRLKNYDYTQPGAYFVTICTQKRLCLFGNVVDGHMVLNDGGQMVKKWWMELPNKYPTIQTDAHVVMPNHFHGVVVIVGADLRVCPNDDGENQKHLNQKQGAHTGAPLPTILQWFKTMTTNAYIQGVKQNGWPPFMGKLWQRNYYEHIVRNDGELNIIHTYIHNNPRNWTTDNNHL